MYVFRTFFQYCPDSSSLKFQINYFQWNRITPTGKLLSQAEKGVDSAFEKLKQKSEKQLNHLKDNLGYGYAEYEVNT